MKVQVLTCPLECCSKPHEGDAVSRPEPSLFAYPPLPLLQLPYYRNLPHLVPRWCHQATACEAQANPAQEPVALEQPASELPVFLSNHHAVAEYTCRQAETGSPGGGIIGKEVKLDITADVQTLVRVRPVQKRCSCGYEGKRGR